MALHYQITVNEMLDATWSAWFDGLTITHNADGNTLITGLVRDQTALYGLIDKARDLGLTLISVYRINQREKGVFPIQRIDKENG
ncbi:MAG: hypothetical protein KF893_22935 [Caldilineaceae bacterium]|nr:hypothetical protein [Caldilineaceae bacterium]